MKLTLSMNVLKATLIRRTSGITITIVALATLFFIARAALLLQDKPLSTNTITSQEQKVDVKSYDAVKTSREQSQARSKKPLPQLREPW